MLVQLLALVVLVALTAATFIICFEKWGWLRAMEVHGPGRCDFCLGFWIGVVLTVNAVAWLALPWWWVLGALPAAALCRAVVNFSSE
ncbi:hypothetical protein [Hymenobacter sp. YC55]|uniref:hypothetical protein n=1 Tax=Hymenobacter sp. YC55 TaxID=3034019 RepID=UPI0023F91694|nr:hypothetical protein [Hymenobacter sp. YC55]MDF7810704.1 hypothetical protein [Hymenobacter sp. YC55]